MKECVDFFFGHNQGEDGFRSVDWGIINANLRGGMFEENYIPPREIRETRVRGSEKPHFHGIDNLPFEFTLNFAFDDFTGDGERKHAALRELSYWITKNYYVPFGVSGMDRLWYVTSVGESDLFHTGAEKGYTEITFRTDAPWCYSEIKDIVWDGLDPDKENTVDFTNNGDLPIYPELWFKMPFISSEDGGKGDFILTKKNNESDVFKFTDILSEEEIYVHNAKRVVESSTPSELRYDNFNRNYLKLNRGKTRLKIKGAEWVMLRYQERMITI